MHDTLSIIIPIAVAHIVVLTILLLVVRQLLLGDTKKAVEKIKEVESEVRKKEESIRYEIEKHEKEFEQKKAEAEAELMRHKDASEKEVAELKEKMIADAKKESARIIEMAHKNEAKFRAQIVQELEEKAVNYAAEIFHLVFSERMGKELHRQFMAELLDALSEVDGANITIEGDDYEFIAGYHIDDDQREKFEEILKDKFNIDVKIKEKIDEDLLAGMIFKLGSLEIDASLRNRYREATDEVKKMAHQATV